MFSGHSNTEYSILIPPRSSGMIIASGVPHGCKSLNVIGLEFESRLSPRFLFLFFAWTSRLFYHEWTEKENRVIKKTEHI